MLIKILDYCCSIQGNVFCNDLECVVYRGIPAAHSPFSCNDKNVKAIMYDNISGKQISAIIRKEMESL